MGIRYKKIQTALFNVGLHGNFRPQVVTSEQPKLGLTQELFFDNINPGVVHLITLVHLSYFPTIEQNMYNVKYNRQKFDVNP